MFARAMRAATPLRSVNADIASRDYVDDRAPFAPRGRPIGRAEAELPWEVDRPAARTAVRRSGCARRHRARRCAPTSAICVGDEE